MPRYMIEVDCKEANRDLFFHPLGENLRGRFRVENVRIADAYSLHEKIPGGFVPGQLVEVDTDSGACAIIEPLWRKEHTRLAVSLLKHAVGNRASLAIADDGEFSEQNLEGRPDASAIARQYLPPPRRVVESAHAPTWLYWAWRACQSGAARVVNGSPALPTDHPEARRNHGRQPMPDAKDAQIGALLAALLGKMSQAERKQYDAIMNPPKA